MGKRNTVSNMAAGAAVAICLSTIQVVQADETPFMVQSLPKGSATGQKLAHGKCGARCGGMMEGRCGGMTEGMMMGGAMPRGADPAQLPDPRSPGARLLGKYCAQCHGLPTLNLHSAEGWLPVVNRMNARMQWMSRNSNMGVHAPSRSELQTIVGYLQSQAVAPEADRQGVDGGGRK